MAIGTITVVASFVFIFRHRWDLQHILVTSGFTFFHYYWWQQIHSPAINNDFRLIGILSVAVVGIMGAITHYQKDYESKTLDALPFAAHILNWPLLGLNLYLYSTGSSTTPFLILAGGVCAFILSRRAKKLQIQWLYTTDTLVSELFLLVSVLSFARFQISPLLLATLSVVVAIGYLLIALKEEEKILKQLCKYLVYGVSIATIIAGLYLFKDIQVTQKATLITAVFSALSIGILGFRYLWISKLDNRIDEIPIYTKLKGDRIQSSLSVFSIFAGIFSTIAVFSLIRNNQFFAFWELGLLANILGLTFFKVRFKSFALYLSILFLTVLGHIIVSFNIFDPSILRNYPTWKVALKIIALTLVHLIGMRYSTNELTGTKVKWPFIYMLGALYTLYIYKYLNPISNILPGLVWALSAVTLIEFGKWLLPKESQANGDTGRFVIHLGILFIPLFCARHILVHMQIHDYIGPIKIRFLIEILAIAIFSFIASNNWSQFSNRFKLLSRVFPLFLELIIITSIFTVALEFEQIYHPIFWTTFTLLSLWGGKALARDFQRLKLYSLFFSWWTIVHISAVTSVIQVPDQSFYAQGWFIGLILLAIQGAFLLMATNREYFKEVAFPKVLALGEKVSSGIAKKETLWAFAPFFIGIAIFLYWRFDKAYLTLLWVVEIFVIFSFGIYRREKVFSSAALGLLGVSLIRLVFYDLKNTGTLTRGLVFLGVGAIMLLMSSIQKRYKDRFLS